MSEARSAPDDSTPRGRLESLHREFGIAPNYAADRRLPLQTEAGEPDLVEIGVNDEGRPIRLLAPAAHAWRRMLAAAADDRLTLVPISGYRSIERQAEIIRGKLAAGHRIADILRYIAAPGYSEHHTGRALDIGSPDHLELDEDFARTPAFRWLEQNAARFSFHLSYPPHNAYGIGYEPWHWCWSPLAPHAP